MATPSKGKKKPPGPPPSESDDLIPQHMLPESSVIPEWRQFGYGVKELEEEKKKAKKKAKGMRSGGYVRGADGCATKGKTRGKYI